MTSHRSSPRPHLPHLAWIVSALVLLSLLGGPATSAPPALTLHSPNPGALHLTWPAVTPAPPAYHVQYAPADTPLLIEQATSATNTLTLYDLEPGVLYTVQVRAGTGPWSVPGLQRIDDYRADPETVGTIGVGAEEAGYIESAGDTDWFFVDLAAGEGYPIAVTGAPAPSLAVYDATGAVVQQGLAWHHASALTFTPATAGLYHLAVGGPEAAPGYYTLTVDEPPTTGSRRSRTLAGATPTAAPAPQRATAAPAKPRGLTATATHDGVVLTWDDPGDDSITGYVILRRVRVNDVGGEFSELVPDTGSAATTYTDDTVAAETTYTYRIKAINKHGVSERSRWFHIDIPAAPEPEEEQAAEPPARPTGLASAAASDLVLLSWADPGDDSVTGYRILRRQGIADEAEDFLTLAEDTGTAETSYADDTVENGRVYVYRVLAIGPGGVSEPSRDVRVRTTTPVPPPDPQRGLPSQSTPQPRQSVSEPSGDDFPDDGTSTGRLEVGGSVTGNIDSNRDRDAFAVELVRGRTYRFDLEGSATEQGTLADPEITYIFAWEGNSASVLGGTSDEDSGEGKNSKLTFTLGSNPEGTPYPTGTYYLLVAEAGDDATGTYRLSAMQVAANSYGGVYPVEGNLQPGGTLSGTLDVPTNYGFYSYYFALEDLEVGRYTVDFGTGTIHSIHATVRRDGEDDVMIIRAQPDPTGRKGRSTHSFDVRPALKGTHYALLYIRNGDVGTYTATLEEAMPSLRVGGPAVEGKIREPKGNNYPGYGTYMLFYSVDLEDGETYQVDVKGKATGDGTMNRTMLGHVQAPDGSFVEGDNNLFVYGGGEGHNTRYFFTADQDGTHFLKVGGRIFTVSDGVSRYRAGTFKVSVQDVTGMLPSFLTDATLRALKVNDGSSDLALSPSFAGDIRTYTAAAAYDVGTVTVTPRTSQPSATIAWLDENDMILADADTNESGHQVELEEGDNVFKVRVTARDNTTTKTYTVTVTRAAPDCTPDASQSELWCGVVTVKRGGTAVHIYGYQSVDNVGRLSDRTFTVGSNNYTISAIYVSVSGLQKGDPVFTLTSGLSTADKAALVLHHGGEEFAFSAADVSAGKSYSWAGSLDWSSEEHVELRLRASPAP